MALGLRQIPARGPRVTNRGFRIPNSRVPPKWILDSIKIMDSGFYTMRDSGLHALDSGFQSLTFAGFRIPSYHAILVKTDGTFNFIFLVKRFEALTSTEVAFKIVKILTLRQ